MNKNNFAPNPPMGWNSYDYYDTAVNEEQIKANADYMAKYLKKFGWEYIVVDIEWYAHNPGSRRDEHQYIPFGEVEMDEYSRLLPDPVRFPCSVDGKGFKPLADYIHSLGLKFGIHIMRGIPRGAAHSKGQVLGADVTADEIANAYSICGWNPDMYGIKDTLAGQAYYNSIIDLYASWGVDFIKCDDIGTTSLYKQDLYSGRHEIEMIAKAIEKSGRPIVLSLSPGPALIEKAWHYKKFANMWRVTDDFWDNWDLLKDMFTRCELWESHVSKGCYPDCDMLPLGMVGKGFGQERETMMTKEEQKTMMTLWCIFGSPLMLGAEMTKMDDWTVSLLTNEKILAMLTVDCVPKQIYRDEKKAVWMAYNQQEEQCHVALFNLSEETKEVGVYLKEICSTNTNRELEELWSGERSKVNGAYISADIPPHGCKVYLVK